MTPQELHAQAAADLPLSPAAVELVALQLERLQRELEEARMLGQARTPG